MAERVHGCGTPGLGLWDQVSCYCERAGDPGLWAEPLNAMTNLAFFFAALMAYTDLRVAGPKRGGMPVLSLIGLMMVVGAGSFLYHTFATRWALLGDIVPIGVFIFAYVALAFRRFLGLPVWLALAAAAVVAALTFLMPTGVHSSMMYLPAILTMGGTAAYLTIRGHGSARWLTAATGVFLVSLTFRTIDNTALVCGPHHVGTHWLWHILNATTLYLLVRAVIENASESPRKVA